MALTSNLVQSLRSYVSISLFITKLKLKCLNKRLLQQPVLGAITFL